MKSKHRILKDGEIVEEGDEFQTRGMSSWKKCTEKSINQEVLSSAYIKVSDKVTWTDFICGSIMIGSPWMVCFKFRRKI